MKKVLRDAIQRGIDLTQYAGDVPLPFPETLMDKLWERNVKYVDRLVSDFVAEVRAKNITSLEDLAVWFDKNRYRERLMGRYLGKQGLTAGFAWASSRVYDAKFVWTRTILESCDSCVERGNQVYEYNTLLAIGFPGSDWLDCGSNCHCILMPTDMPETYPERSAEIRHYGPGSHKGTKTPQTVHGKKSQRAAVHKALATGPIENVVSLMSLPRGEAAHATSKRQLWVADVGGVRSLIKTTSVDQELASGIANELLGDHVDLPTLVERDAPNGDRAVFVEWLQAKPALFIPIAEVRKNANKDDLHRMDLVDAVTANFDRHRGNFLIEDDWHVRPIDNGYAWDNLPAWAATGQPARAKGWTRWSDQKLTDTDRAALETYKGNLRNGGRDRLRAHVSDTAIDDSVKRINWMLENGRMWRDDQTAGVEVDA